MQLPSVPKGPSTQLVAKAGGEDLEFQVQRFSSLDETDLAWATLPEVVMKLWAGPLPTTPAIGPMLSSSAKTLGRAVLPHAGPTVTRVGPVLVIDTSVQSTRMTAAVVEELVRRYGSSKSIRLPILGAGSLVRAALGVRRVKRGIRAATSDAGLGTPASLQSELAKVEILRRRFAKVRLPDQGVSTVVVASQQNSSIRAMLSVAHRQGVASCYIPHAPTAYNQIYRDLPTTHALLRGIEDVYVYRHLGAKPADRLIVVGNPAAEPGPSPGSPPSSDIVYAPSTHHVDVIRADIAVILEACDQPIKVAMHPLMDLATYQDLLPPTWQVVSAPDTLSYLRQHGAKALIQHSSGVALDALTLGIDVVDLCDPGGHPNYHFMREPHVQIVTDGNELRNALQALPGRAEASTQRAEYARRWCADDRPAAELIVDAIQSAHAERGGDSEVLLDGWSDHFEERGNP